MPELLLPDSDQTVQIPGLGRVVFPTLEGQYVVIINTITNQVDELVHEAEDEVTHHVFVSEIIAGANHPIPNPSQGRYSFSEREVLTGGHEPYGA